MRRVPLVLFFAVVRAFAQTAATPQPAVPAQTVERARVEGRILSQAGEPLRKANVRLQGAFTAAPSPGTPATPPNSYSSQTDAEGNFVFEEVEPGRYTLSAERTGYVRGVYGAPSNFSPAQPIHLSAGQKLTGVSIKLTPQGVISGKVTDEDGDPVARSQVLIYQSRYLNGRKTLAPMNSSSSNPDGTFQTVALAAGRYYVSAAYIQTTINSQLNELPGHKGPEEGYVTTYYPNVIDISSAVPIDVASGAEVRGIEIRLQKARVFRIHGKVTGASTSAGNIALQLVSQDSISAIAMGPRGISLVRPDGSFDLLRVVPGAYIIRSQTIRTNGDAGTSTPLYSRQMVTVSDANIDNLEVQLVPGGEVVGKIAIEGRDQQQEQGNATVKAAASGSTPAPSARTSVSLSPVLPAGLGSSYVSGQSNDDGSFRLKNVAPDKYTVVVSGLPAGTYVKSIRYGGQEISRGTLDASSGARGDLQILLSPDATDVSGTVRDAKGDPMANVRALLWEPGSADAAPESIFLRNSVTDQSGSFQFRGLPPGEYRVAAWEEAEPYPTDPHFRAKFESQAATVKLVAGGHGTADVTAIPQAVSDVEAAKLR